MSQSASALGRHARFEQLLETFAYQSVRDVSAREQVIAWVDALRAALRDGRPLTPAARSCAVARRNGTSMRPWAASMLCCASTEFARQCGFLVERAGCLSCSFHSTRRT